MNGEKLPALSGPLPPGLLLLAILLMLVLHLFVPVMQLITFPARLIGAIAVVAGGGLNIWADRSFKRAGTAVRPTEPSTTLVLSGPFLVTRNPMYLGMALVLVGIAIGLGSATPWLVVVLFVWQITARFIVPEECKLKASFGEQFLRYKIKVRRWL